jgi:hypothetical protein
MDLKPWCGNTTIHSCYLIAFAVTNCSAVLKFFNGIRATFPIENYVYPEIWLSA